MKDNQHIDTSHILTSVVSRLAMVSTLTELTQIIGEAARMLTNASGTTFVLKENDKCYYADENAISPLWKGKRFPIEACISGWSIIHREVVCISDIYEDSRIPHDAYRPTFVKSLCMVPIRAEKPIGAIGSYWANKYIPTPDEVKLLKILADSTAVALENLDLKRAVTNHFSENAGLKERSNDLEFALYSMAHDLRSPLSVITGLGEILKSRLKDVSDTSLFDKVQSIVEIGRRTASQIDRMLSLYRATNGKIEKQDVDVTEFSRRIILRFQMLFPQRTIHFEIEPNMKTYADPSLIYIVLENLLSNAIKYSSKKSETNIHIGWKTDHPNRDTFYVKDNGHGFAPAEAQQLFQPLRRLDTKWEFGGVGLGLASVAHIVSLHGGEVRAEGKQMEGATFYFSLPHRLEAASA